MRGTVLLLLALSLPVLRVYPVSAQEEIQEVSRPDPLCWRGRPRQDCRTFFLVELQLDRVVFSSSRIRTRGFSERPEPAFDHGIGWNLGLMRNVTDWWALGGAASVGTGSTGPVTGLRVRARRWLDPVASVEMEVGARASNVGQAFGTGAVWGPSAGARVNLRDRVSVFARWEGVQAPGGVDRSGAQMAPGFQHGFYVGAALGSTWSLVGSAVLGVLALWLYSQDWDEG